MSLSADFLDVRKGDPVTAEKWTRMQREAEKTTILYGGENTRIIQTTRGTMVNAYHTGGFTHPWRTLVSSHSAVVWPGTINGDFPKIKDKEGGMVDITKRPPPVVDMDGAKFNPYGVGWIALELELETDYRKIKTATVLQAEYIVGSEGHGDPNPVAGTSNPFFFFGLPGIGNYKVRYPLVRLKDAGTDSRGNRIFDSYQVAMFNLNHACKPPAGAGNPGQQIPRHFFWPV